MTLIKFNEPSQCLSQPIKRLTYLGFWKQHTTNKVFLVYSVLIEFSVIHIPTLLAMIDLCLASDIETLSNTLYLLMTYIALSYKVINFNQKFPKIINIMEKLDSKSFSITSNEDIKSMTRATILVRRLFFVFMGTSYVTLVGWTLSPILTAINNGKFIEKPLPGWYPVKWIESSIGLIFIYVFQIIGVYLSATINLSIDIIFVGFMAIANAQIQILGNRLSNLGHYQFQNTQKYIENANQHYSDMRKIILLHLNCLSLIKDIEDVCKAPLFTQLGCSVLVLSATLYRMLSIPLISVDAFNQLAYLFVMCGQIFLYCWMGNEIIHSSRILTAKAYLSNFIIFNKKTSLALVFFMQKSFRDIVLHAVGLFSIPLSLETFVVVIKTSYTYFAVLQSIKN